MPIYEYHCDDCGASTEHLQRMDDAPIAVCPQCGSVHYRQLVSAAAFQLKGTGWYATDFKNPVKPKAAVPAQEDKASETKTETKTETSTGTGDNKANEIKKNDV